jgi:hypothetical protein
MKTLLDEERKSHARSRLHAQRQELPHARHSSLQKGLLLLLGSPFSELHLQVAYVTRENFAFRKNVVFDQLSPPIAQRRTFRR